MASLQKLFYFFPLLLLPSFSISEPYKNISLGSSLTAGGGNSNNNGSYWPSPSGDFAFGFLQLGRKGFLLAIWFNKIPQNTVVWSANRNNLVPAGSTVQLTTRGQLLLNGPGGNQTWATNLLDNNAAYAAMLDSGNFILAGTGNDYSQLWQSFDTPTDTILPSQTISGDLIAPYSESDYSEGRFRLSMESNGNLVLTYPATIPMRATPTSYWESKTAGSGNRLVFNLSASIYVSARNESAVKTLTSNAPSTEDFYHRAIFEYDGVFRHYVYPKPHNASPWPQAWSRVSNSVPPNICLPIVSGLGSGACGYNSYCSIGDDQRPTCHCPRGYDYLDPNDAIKGCKPSFIPQSCDDPIPEIDAFEYFPIENSDWPDSDYEAFHGVDEDWCRRICLEDCFCAAVVFQEYKCWKKKFPLSFGRIDLNFTGKALIKIRRDNSTSILPNRVKKDRDKTLVVIGSVLLGSSGFLIFILLPTTFLIVLGLKKKRSKIIDRRPEILGVNLRIFSYQELNKATNGFTEQLGSGAFATVYKGIIGSMDNNLVAVKKLDNVVKEGDQEFKAEVSAIARTNHKNLVQLLGFCNEEPHRMLVYEYMPNGSLADFLFGSSKPNWYQRIQVAIGTARGLCYLHEECDTQIIHCDIKPQNILLDAYLEARISDFGLAKLLKKNQTRTMTAIRGTKGYVAPEWFKSLPITVKVDVYSFGILLLEMICCRRSFEMKAENADEMVLADWAYDCFRKRRVKMLVENDEEAKEDMKRVEKFVMIAIWCIQEKPLLRPSMKKVIQMLEGAVEVSTPPDPSLC
ncbi:LOW QUALITY PROTEIN: G-type lectin S-receptor-like serine/threonine-protein kinase LECRK3 [Momordica charantia]|uniref:Receptor-like serine/threonine-protein kinase n=1 Tax=Momordica charantia TaxID=3673 RepID=A0A6J1D5V7_MOMCH|nr:LOW QUALITY PROTEIN: G-type lectin S-receptor-like serine/threonine-protein kinase LECRK3 [Momordica charantia]